ncbi:histidine kinase [Romboutsia weinsteinii]|uniref:histidine kinase n=2 Tax=Romboutsia weinsteinii TaxID=2020949 RepID=A0A371J244_9FIRM|nr:histidine kinase [Romboutsia weinsteinii]
MITIIFIVGFAGNIYAEDYIKFENITIDDGLSQSTVESIFQDSRGYIWIGTNDGLNRYNGFEMKVYKSKKNDKNTIASNHILSIEEDKKGNLWVGTDNGISKINLNDTSIVNYKYDSDNSKYYNIHSILITKNGDVIIGTCGGLYYYNEKSDDFERILDGDSILTSQDVIDIKEDKDKNIWIATGKGLNKVDIKNKKIYKYSSQQENSISSNKINSLMFDNDENLWISTDDSGINKLNIKTNEVEIYAFDEDDKFSIPSNVTRDMLQDQNGTIWIATEKGLSNHIGSGKFATYNNKNYDNNSLVNNIVYTVMEDSTGMIWAGTYTGISTFDPTNQIKQYKSDPLDKNSLSDNVIHGVYEDEDGLLWVGTRDKGLNIVNRENDEYVKFYEGNTDYDLNSNSIRVITGKDNIIWIGTRNGINEVNKDTMVIEKYTVNKGLVSNNIKSILLDSKGYLWIGTPDGLDILDTSTKEIINMTSVLNENDILDTYIEEIYEDSDGIYWIGNFILGGLIKINPYDKSIKTYMTYDIDSEEYDEDSIKSIRSITEDKKGNLWIGTSDGLVRFNKSSESFKRYTDKDGLPNNTIYGILIDDDGNPWISTNNGISKFDLKINKFSNLSSTDGLQSSEFNGKAYYKSKSGEFLFGGVKGLNSFYPDKILNSSYKPIITFDNFEVEGKIYSNINGLSFKYNDNSIRIKYFITEYKKNNNIQFRYKLEGSMDDWITSSSNEVIFNELDSGEYTFKIQARSQNGNLSKMSRVGFKIEPPLWRSDKAIVLYTVLVLILIYRHATKVRRLDKLVGKKTEELSKQMERNNELLNKIIEVERNKNNYFVNLSHELRTPLNVISSVEQLITNLSKSEEGIGKEKLEYYLDVMRKNLTRLLSLINNIIDTTKIENGKYNIILEDQDIVYIVEETTLGLKDAIESFGINLIIDTNVEEKMVICDKYEIERCIVNLVSNASKFTPKNGSIKVDIKDLGERVMISVEDTGIGIDKKYHESIFDRFNQVVDKNTEVKGGSGLGLTITKHIIDLHNGEIYVESEKDKGTKFTIILPVS